MKKSVFTSIITLIAGIIIFGSCVKETPDVPPESTIPFDPNKVWTIDSLKFYYDKVNFMVNLSGGDLDSLNVYLEDTYGIKANSDGTFSITTGMYSLFSTVTMDESSGNIYEAAYIQDPTGAIQLNLISSGGLYTGDSIRILLQNAKVELYPENGGLYQVHNVDVGESVYKIATGQFIEPELTTIQQVKSNISYYQSRLIQLDSIQFMDSELGKTFADGVNQTDENVLLEDCNGNSIEIRTSGYANFADSLLPAGKGSMIAIASVYYDAQLVIRSYDELDLTGERCDGSSAPVNEINEPFDNAVNYTDYSQKGWSNIIIAGDRRWQGKTYNSEKYVQSSGFNSGLANMETWLITPLVINTNGDKKLNFKTAMAYWTHSIEDPITVYASINFDGINFEAATWEELSPTLANVSSGDNTWIESGEISLEAFVGNVAIAFKYKGSNTESTSIRIDDVIINTSGGGGGNEIDPVENVMEYFDDAEDYTDIDIDGWTNMIVAGTRKWQGKTFNDEKYAQATGYNSGLSDMEVWMITPPVINTAGDKSLSFNTSMAFWTHSQNDPITVYASTDYDGTNFTTAVWDEISAVFPTQATPDHAWVPSGTISLAAYNGNVAIAFKYKGSDAESTSIRIDDVVITGGGGGGGSTIFTENFDAGWGNFEAVSLVGSQVWERDNTSGPDGSACAEISGYELGNFSNDDWLISPAIDLSTYTSATLLFESARNYDGAPIEIKVSTDYAGNPNSATWTTLSATLSQSGYNWVSSGNVNLSSFAGQAVYIAFQYTSTTQLAATWRVDNIEVKAE